MKDNLKKALVILIAALLITCMVSCAPEPEPEPEPGPRVSIYFDGETYNPEYVYSSFHEGEGIEIVFSTNGELEDIYNDPGTHFEFEIPVECFNKSLTYSDTELFKGYSWDFYGYFFLDDVLVVDLGIPSNGTSMNLSCEVVDGKVNSFSFTYNGTIDGKLLSVTFSGSADFVYSGIWLC